MADIKKIDIVLNKFLVEQGLADSLCACYIEDCDSYYQYDAVLSRVVLGGLTNKKADEIYMDYCRELGLKVDVDVMTMSFLHEVGHHNTIDFLDGEEIFESEMIKLLLAANNKETKEYFMKYFECPEEYEATWDAVSFCNAYPEVVLQLDADIQNALYGG